MSVEWSYAQIVQYWAWVNNPSHMKVGQKRIALIYEVAALLANFAACVHGRNTNGVYFDVKSPTIREHLVV